MGFFDSGLDCTWDLSRQVIMNKDDVSTATRVLDLGDLGVTQLG